MCEIIRLKNICKSYKTNHQEISVLLNINISLFKGESVALLGTSGSGKSTLLNILGLLDSPTKGQYFLKNEDVSEKNITECAMIRNKIIGFIFQRFHLLPHLTAQENVALPLSYRGIKMQERMDQAEQILKRFELGDRLQHLPTELSGGQCQRVAIARALITDPDIILADEPTGSLDSKSAQQVVEVLQEVKYMGKTLITVTHDHIIAGHMERVLSIQDGHL